MNRRQLLKGLAALGAAAVVRPVTAAAGSRIWLPYAPYQGAEGSYSDKVLSIRPANLIGYWPFSDHSGASATSALSKTGNILKNGSLDEVAEDQSTHQDWDNNLGSGGGAISYEAADVHRGLGAVRITAGASYWQTNFSQTFAVVPGQTYYGSFWTHGVAGVCGKYLVYDATHDTPIIAEKSTDVTGDQYAPVSFAFVAPAGCTSAFLRFEAGAPQASALFDDAIILAPASAAIRSGAYTGNYTLGVPGIGDGLTAVRLNGAGCVDVRVGPVHNEFSTREGTVLIWYRYKQLGDCAGGEGTQQTMFSAIGALAGGVRDNIFLEKDVEDGGLLHHSQYYYAGAAAPETQHIEYMDSYNLDWHALVMTWSASRARLTVYDNGELPSTYLPPYDTNADGIETPFRGYPNQAIVFGAFMGMRYWKGDLAHGAIWNTELSAAEVGYLSQV